MGPLGGLGMGKGEEEVWERGPEGGGGGVEGLLTARACSKSTRARLPLPCACTWPLALSRQCDPCSCAPSPEGSELRLKGEGRLKGEED